MQSSNNPQTKTLINNFQEGDLVYGLAEPRARIVAELKKLGYTYLFANTLNDKLVSLVIRQESPEGLADRKLSHFHFLNSQREYLIKPNGKPILAMRKSNDVSAAYRRSCKATLIRRDDRRYNVHFLLEGIDWERICTKKFDDTLDDSVTASELRAAYRDFLQHGVHPNIIFYDQHLRPLDKAPWERPELVLFFDAYNKLRLANKELEEASTQECDDIDESDATPNQPVTEADPFFCDEVLSPAHKLSK